MNISGEYDVFLSYDPTEVEAVEQLARHLQSDEIGLRPWFDRWHLVPGKPRQEQIEEALAKSLTCAVFIGAVGFSGWHQEQMRVALETRILNGGFRIIPVLLHGAIRPERGDLPPFLQRHVVVDFRAGLDDEQSLHALISGIKGVAPGVSLQRTEQIQCPYRGLLPFYEEHKAFFFGREVLTQYLVNDLQQTNFLLVNGASGSGKSSLVHAGLLPQLKNGAILGSQEWLIARMRPDSTPLDALAGRLVSFLEPSDPIATRHSLVEAMKVDPKEFARSVRQIQFNQNSTPFLLVVDQFEEVFTRCSDEQERQVFIDALLYATEPAQRDILCIFIMRADFYGSATLYPELGARIERRQRNVSPMSSDEMRAAIEAPAQLVGLFFEKGLVDTILADAGATLGVLPLLEHTLWELCQHRRGEWLTFDAYRAIGGVQGALANRAEDIYRNFSSTQQLATQQLMLRLTQPGIGTEDTRRRATKSELLGITALHSEMIHVIQSCTDSRLLTTSYEEETKSEVIDIAHEALIRGWPRLRGWLDADRANILVHRRLTDAATEWSLRSKDRTLLYHGARLNETLHWANTHSNQLNDLESRFLQASRSARTITWIYRGSGILLSILLVGITVLATLGILSSLIYRPIPPDMISIPSGPFIMGISPGEVDEVNKFAERPYGMFSEMPAHEVFLDTYEIMRYETTNREYRQCVKANQCSEPSDNGRWNDPDYVAYPVVGVNWNDANTYCRWIGGNLPTEAQWEKAARGSTGWRYPWGNEPDATKANVNVSIEPGAKPVGSYPAGVSPYGVADMAGNVWEWTADYYDDSYYATLSPNVRNPTGPPEAPKGEERYRTVRSGTYDDDWVQARTTYRGGNVARPGDTSYNLGFRCIRSQPP